MLLRHERAQHTQHVRRTQAAEEAVEVHARRPIVLWRRQPEAAKEALASVERFDGYGGGGARASRRGQWRRERRPHERRHEADEVVVELQDVEHMHEQREPGPLREDAEADG